jgi:protein CpxP
MKQIFSLMIALLFTSSMAMAQNENSSVQQRPNFDPAIMAQRRTEHMAKELSLTADQKAQILSLNQEYATKMVPQAPKNVNGEKRTKAEKEQIHQQKEAEKVEYDAKLKTILTPEQYNKYTQQKQMRMQKRMNQGDRNINNNMN